MVMLYLLLIATILNCFSLGGIKFSLSFGYYISFVLDSYSLIFFYSLFSISSSVLLWSYYYLDSEPKYKYFCSLIFIFLFSMFLLIFACDLLSLFVAWDLLGFSSFFLVIFYRSRSSLAGGLLTTLSNRVGDVLLFVAVGLILSSSSSSFSLPAILVLLASFTKSAQVPFSSWLPAAILAPTPVSALVHSSTLVTAGVYLLLRFGPASSALVLFVGIFTTLISGLACFLEVDLKKIIALSTLRQLGIMMCSIGLGLRGLAFAHLNLHASFKALLFIVTGTLIHVLSCSQDYRHFSSLFLHYPFLITCLLMGVLSMCGLVFLSGWASKDVILESCYNHGYSYLCALLFYLGLSLTVAYSFRFVLQFSSDSFTAVPLTGTVILNPIAQLPLL